MLLIKINEKLISYGQNFVLVSIGVFMIILLVMLVFASKLDIPGL